MPMSDQFKQLHQDQMMAVRQAAELMHHAKGDYSLAAFDSMNTTPHAMTQVFDACGDAPVMRDAFAEGVRLGINGYQARNGGEMPTPAMVACGLSAGAALFSRDPESGKNAFDSMGFDSLHAMNHEALSVVPAMTVVTISTAIANSLAIVAMLPNSIGSNEVPLVYARFTAGRTHGGMKKGEFLDGDKASVGYFENRFRIALANTTGNTYAATSHASIDPVTKVPDATSPLAPFLGGRVVIYVNGIEVGNDRSRNNTKQSGTTAIMPKTGVSVAGTPVTISTGTTNLDTHNISVTFAAALPAGAVVHAGIVFDFERLDANEQPIIRVPNVDIDVEYQTVFAYPSRSQLKASIDAISQMSNELGMGFMGAALGYAQNRYYFEQTLRLLGEGKERAAMNGRVFTFDAQKGTTGNLASAYMATADLIAEQQKVLQFAALKISQAVGQSINSFDLFVADRGAVLFKTMRDDMFVQTAAPLATHSQIVRIGTLKSGINVYHVPTSTGLLNEANTASQALLIARSPEAAKSTFVGHVAVPPTIRTANPSEFTEQVGVYSRIAAELNPIGRYADQVALIEMINLPLVG